MNNFFYQKPTFQGPLHTNNVKNYPYQTPGQMINDERFGGGFLLPFLTGAVVSAPFWYIGANNKAQQNYQQSYYRPQYPAYYPYTLDGQSYPSYYPYPN